MKTSSSQPLFDELIHAPIRLRLCAGLATVQWAEFAQLRETLKISDSVLSKHLKQLSDVGYLQVERFLKAGRSHLRVSLTSKGRAAYVGHVAALRAITGTAES